MLPRVQRICAGIELFALVFWVGGLFALIGIATPVIAQEISGDRDLTWRLADALYGKFGALELIFGPVVVASNILKMMLFRDIHPLQRFALLVSAIMLMFSSTDYLVIKSRIEEKKVEIGSLNLPAASPKDREVFDKLCQQREILMMVTLALGLFMVYSYGTFEERKLLVLSKSSNLH